MSKVILVIDKELFSNENPKDAFSHYGAATAVEQNLDIKASSLYWAFSEKGKGYYEDDNYLVYQYHVIKTKKAEPWN